MSNIEDQVCQDIQTRASVGLTKYGVTTERTDLSQSEWIQHAYEECLDMAVYLKRLQKEASHLSIDDKKFLLGILRDVAMPLFNRMKSRQLCLESYLKCNEICDKLVNDIKMG